MPIYEFNCQKCGVLFEVLVSSTTPDSVVCAKCGSKEVKKIISAASIRLSSPSGLNVTSGSSPGCASGSGFS